MIISIHAPREGGDKYIRSTLLPTLISIHAPREGGDLGCGLGVVLRQISIHAPREGGDDPARLGPTSLSHFNPRPPRGGRHRQRDTETYQDDHFNPRPPRGGATPPVHGQGPGRQDFNPRPPRGGRLPDGDITDDLVKISIHAPREGGDAIGCLMALVISIFQSTPPARGATETVRRFSMWLKFQSTPPARGATTSTNRDCSGWFYFNPRPPRGGRPQAAQ